MYKFWHKQKQEPAQSDLQWDTQAQQAVDQALAQAPVPAMLKGQVKKELTKAAEAAARAAGHEQVTAEDVMAGLLSKMPAKTRQKVEDAMKGGPEKLRHLQDELNHQK
ncbi:MAG: hypothetical protein U1C49_00950 [Candidatus Andersenbacteria bacterium]|nr:hypothetical protein [bacterium]MDZ4225394.1 hypothetical protein [Candidatus Andersenbacteria bacterium]